ncbi:hypothetical protein D3C87_1521080 [compost metagenome]
MVVHHLPGDGLARQGPHDGQSIDRDRRPSDLREGDLARQLGLPVDELGLRAREAVEAKCRLVGIDEVSRPVHREDAVRDPFQDDRELLVGAPEFLLIPLLLRDVAHEHDVPIDFGLQGLDRDRNVERMPVPVANTGFGVRDPTGVGEAQAVPVLQEGSISHWRQVQAALEGEQLRGAVARQAAEGVVGGRDL